MPWRNMLLAVLVGLSVGYVVAALALSFGAAPFLAGALGGSVATSVANRVRI